jgi:hypothetical protein
MLDARGGGSDRIGEGGGDFGRGAPIEGQRSGGRQQAGRFGGGGSMSEELDDEIPF